MNRETLAQHGETAYRDAALMMEAMLHGYREAIADLKSSLPTEDIAVLQVIDEEERVQLAFVLSIQLLNERADHLAGKGTGAADSGCAEGSTPSFATNTDQGREALTY